MSLSGSLKDLPLPHFLQTIGAGGITGKLILRCRDGSGLIVFREGKIIYAATNSARETIGNILLLRGLIDASTLTEALHNQGHRKEETRLGTILLEMGAVDRETLEEVMKEQVAKVLVELFSWGDGFVKFEPLDIHAHGELAVDASDLLVSEGLPTEGLIFDAMKEIDLRRGEQLEERVQAMLVEGSGPARAEASAGAGRGAPRQCLKALMSEIRSLEFTGEVTLGILRFASQLMSRGVLFLHSSGHLTGMGQFGVELPGGVSAEERVRKLRIPEDEPSVFLDVLVSRETYRGPLERRYWNAELTRALGGRLPEEVVVVPMVVEERVPLVFYGDNAPTNQALPPVDELELLMIQAGLAVEKSLLKMKLESIQRRDGAAEAPRAGAPAASAIRDAVNRRG